MLNVYFATDFQNEKLEKSNQNLNPFFISGTFFAYFFTELTISLFSPIFYGALGINSILNKNVLDTGLLRLFTAVDFLATILCLA